MVSIENKITELTDFLKHLRNKLDYLEEAIRDNEPHVRERLDDRVNESEVLKEQLKSLARDVYGHENVPLSMTNRISICNGIQQDIIKRIDRIRTLREHMDDDDDPIFDKDSFIKGMFPNEEDYQDYVDGEI